LSLGIGVRVRVRVRVAEAADAVDAGPEPVGGLGVKDLGAEPAVKEGSPDAGFESERTRALEPEPEPESKTTRSGGGDKVPG